MMLSTVGLSNVEDQLLRGFIADAFKEHYSACVDTFCQCLVGVRNAQGVLCAAAGYNFAEQCDLFLEQYLGQPIEQYLMNTKGLVLARSDIVEVGNLAATEAGGSRLLIRLITQHLYSLGKRWVTFTATRRLVNSFHRMGLNPVVIAKASPALVKNLNAWGSYYDHEPLVVIGNVSLGYAHLNKQIPLI
jgi:hypothetical protein